MMRKQTVSMLITICMSFMIVITNYANEPYWKVREPYQGKLELKELRQIYLLNNDWYYLEQNIPTINELNATNMHWQNIDLPHTWNAFDATDNEPGYRRDAGWYRKNIFIPKTDDPRIYRLYFEGVNISSEIYMNGKKAGEHVGGYVGFTVDITPHLRLGERNELIVRADNSMNPNIIPSQKSDFFIFGGITRDVWLQVLNTTFIDRVHISTPRVTDKVAETISEINLSNTANQKKKYTIEAVILNPDNKVVSKISIQKKIEAGAGKITMNLPVVKNPQLWSPDHPQLHELTLTLKDGEKVVDRISERFGFRWYEFAEHGPFYLNGKRLLLRGTHRHEEYAGYGNAMPDSLHRRDIKMMKEMGANFVRLAHYPQDPEIYRACDELGLLVWDELPWCRGGMGGKEWQANTKRLLKEQIEQNYNHPSIILWSVGNEMYWLPDFPNGGDPDSLKDFVSQLNDLTHELDPHRLTTMRKFYDGAELTDVFSPSIWAGWYSGVYKTYREALEISRDKYKRFFHAEYGGSSHIGRHTENPITGEGMIEENEWSEQPNMINIKKISSDGDWSENYIVDLFDWHLMVSEKLPWFTGNAQWAFKDFGTPLRPENPIPYMNQKGLVDRAGKPKDAYYVFKSYWTTDPKFCYIESPTWIERNGRQSEMRQVCVYSNCDQVRLVLNGNELELRERNISDFPACGFHWDVKFRKGGNELTAIGYSDEQEVTRHAIELMYSTKKFGKPEELVLSADRLENGNYLINARVVDEKGQTCLDFNERVYFDHNGAGSLKVNLGTPNGSSVIECANGRAAIEYVPDEKGSAVIEARTQDFKGTYIHFPLTNE